MRARQPIVMATLLLISLASVPLRAQPPENSDRPSERPGRQRDGGLGPEDRGRMRRPEGRPGPAAGMSVLRAMPLFTALDQDKDGQISALEISQATVLLKTLDKNDDGKLDEQELRPDMRGMLQRGGGRFGPPGFGGRADLGPSGFDRGGRGRPADSPADAIPAATMVDRLLQFDSNGDGKLTEEELPEQFQSSFVEADIDNDGYASRPELLALAEKRSPAASRGMEPNPQAMVKRLFEQYDSDNDGTLSENELPDRMAQRFRQMDANADNAIDQDELVEAMQRISQRGDRPPGNRFRDRP